MNQDEKYMLRCLEIASLGLGNTAPNPLVGSVIVNNGKIIGEGFHNFFGGPHAEVNAINSVKNKELLSSSVLYVNLEPCSHFGKTPPCTDIILKYKIPEVVIGSKDTGKNVHGDGIRILKEAGCKVTVGVFERESRNLNRFFYTYNEDHRPYIILKWAQTTDGFIDRNRKPDSGEDPEQITDEVTRVLVHKWRAETQSIMVGKNTATFDNPALTVRKWQGKNPIRIVIDRELSLSPGLKLFDGTSETIVFTEMEKISIPQIDYRKIDFKKDVIPQILEELYYREIQSLIIEGGAITLSNFINEGLWDEASILVSENYLYSGVKAPEIKKEPAHSDNFSKCRVYTYYNNKF